MIAFELHDPTLSQPSHVPDVSDLLPALVATRRDLHAHPELAFAERRTAGIVAAALRADGLDVHEEIGGTGVVGILRTGSSDRRIALRADMDALPILEQSGKVYASRAPGVFHGCGHDGHTTMLLGAARHLARTRRFDGTVCFIFQPAEEGQAGGRAMIEAGLFDRFPSDLVFALHNWPELPVGAAQTRTGAIMAAADRFDIAVRSRGGHAALPHLTPDALLAAADLVTQLNAITARRISPFASAVLSVTRIEGGHTHNVLPANVAITGTVRTFNPSVQDAIEAAVRLVAQGVGMASGTTVDVAFDRYYPATVNDPAAAEVALAAAVKIGLDAKLAPNPSFASEDFSFMLQRLPGAYLWLGQGGRDTDAPLHHPGYDFNDDIIPLGIGWFTALVEACLSPS